jgi:hypothetical protein
MIFGYQIASEAIFGTKKKNTAARPHPSIDLLAAILRGRISNSRAASKRPSPEAMRLRFQATLNADSSDKVCAGIPHALWGAVWKQISVAVLRLLLPPHVMPGLCAGHPRLCCIKVREDVDGRDEAHGCLARCVLFIARSLWRCQHEYSGAVARREWHVVRSRIWTVVARGEAWLGEVHRSHADASGWFG